MGKEFKYNSNNRHLSEKTQDWISYMNGVIAANKTHPEYNQIGANPEFWNRLKEKNIRTINVNGSPSSHLMSYGEVNGKYIVYPLVHQGKNGELYYNSDIQHALKNNNFLYAPDEETAKDFAEHYKESESFKGFRKFNPINNISYWNTIQDNFPKIKLIYNKMISKGYSPEQTAGIIGNLVIESKLDEFSTEGNGGHGYGLAQWTTEDRKKSMNEYPGKIYQSEFERQLDFIPIEMQDKNIWNQSKKYKTQFDQQRPPIKSPSVQQATHSFMKGYENPKETVSHYEDRLQVANYILSPEFQSKLKSDLIDYSSTPYDYKYIIEKQGGTMNYLDIYRSGGGIHIKKENRGKFTASAKAAGEGVQEHAHKVMNDPNATPLQKKRANFAIQAKKWHHKYQLGGEINYLDIFVC